MAGKMDQKMIIVSGIVGSLGVLSAILGFSAEATKLTTVFISYDGSVCYYPRNSATGLAICASIFLIIAQVTFAVVSGCCGCCKSSSASESNRVIVLVCAVFSWVAAVIAFALFVDGAVINSAGGGPCAVVKDGIFAGAAVLTLAATALGLTSYVLPRRQLDAAAVAPKAGGGIAMGQPQFPQQSPPQGYGQAPPPNYPQYSPPPPQGTYGQAPNGHFPPPPPPPAQGHGAHAPNQHQQFSPPPQGYGAQSPNQQFPPAAQGYGAYAPNQQFPPPAQGYGAPNQQFPPPTPPPPQRYGAHVPNRQRPPPAHGYAPDRQYPPSHTTPQGYAPPHDQNQQAPTPQGYEQVPEAPEVAAEVAQGEPDGGAWTSEPVGDAEATQY